MIKPNLVLFTNTRGSVWQRSIGAYQVAHHCRKNGFTVQVIDFTDFFTEDELLEIIDKLYSSDMLAVGISTTFYSSLSESSNPLLTTNASSNLRSKIDIDGKIESVFSTIKQRYPKVKIIAGGANSWQVIGNELFDAVFHGYSEVSVANYLTELTTNKKRLYPKKGTTSIVNGDAEHFDVNQLDHMWTDNDIVLDNESLPIEIARGCIFNCKFCSYPLNGKKKFDYIRDPSMIRKELISNYERFGTTNYFFADDTFNDSTNKVKMLHDIFVSLPFKINFVCYLRVDLLMRFPEQIKLLKDMGLCSVVFGIESLHQDAARAIGKGANTNKIKKFLLDLYYKHWSQEVSITCSMIIGLPGETEEHARKVFDWFRTEGKDLCDSWWPLTINTNGHYKSQFEKEYSKYAYVLNEEGDKWTNPVMTYDRAQELSEEFNSVGMLRDNHPGSWMIMALRSYGYTQQELMNMHVRDMPWKTLIKKRIRMFQDYKAKLYLTLE